ncbi:hypothetical protein BIY24_01820 [Halobacteriovorax marinus]|nr:hypothetical protein BIY24_01820 [Halobacteriovorax marinus]
MTEGLRKSVDIILPAYNEELALQSTLEKISKELPRDGYKFTFIVVDDGSEDKTWQELLLLKESYGETLQGVKLSRNFGKESAMFAGISRARDRGVDAVIIMDSDLQHPPSVLKSMLYHWDNDEFKIVQGVKKYSASESFCKVVFSSLFYSVFSKISRLELKAESDFKLLDKVVVECLSNLKERNLFFRGLSSWIGYKSMSIEFDVQEREYGDTKWSFFSLLKYSIGNITSFSSRPLMLVLLLALGYLLLSCYLIIKTLYLHFLGFNYQGYSTILILISITGMCVLFSMGIMGIYVSKLYEEVKGRPRYLIEDTI